MPCELTSRACLHGPGQTQQFGLKMISGIGSVVQHACGSKRVVSIKQRRHPDPP
jgi:hypothetical protein